MVSGKKRWNYSWHYRSRKYRRVSYEDTWSILLKLAVFDILSWASREWEKLINKNVFISIRHQSPCTVPKIVACENIPESQNKFEIWYYFGDKVFRWRGYSGSYRVQCTFEQSFRGTKVSVNCIFLSSLDSSSKLSLLVYLNHFPWASPIHFNGVIRGSDLVVAMSLLQARYYY